MISGKTRILLNRRVFLALWRIAAVVVLFLWIHPVSYGSSRLALIVLLLGMWGSALALWWKLKWVRSMCGAIALGLLLILIIPGTSSSSGQIRVAYIKALKSFEGTKYVWGGENKLGIDCSGLVRRGLITALLQNGITSFNPYLIRQSFGMRWYDCSARALQSGYRNQTRRLFSASSIRQLDHTKLEPGDLAVTANGVHVLAYLGNKEWIEAEPGLGRVVILKASDDNPWLSSAVDLIRWRVLDAGIAHPTTL